MKQLSTWATGSTPRKLLLIVLAAISVGGIWWQLTRAQSEIFSPPVLKAEVLQGEEYVAARDTYADLVIDESPKAALDAFAANLETDSRLLNSCHPIAHYIGNTAFAEYGFADSMSQINSVCNSGYIHGIVEAQFQNLDAIEASVTEICSDFTAGTRISWQCSHGVGHGIMFFTNNDLPASLVACDQMPTDTEVQSCKNGVMMENFLVDGEYHTSDYVSQEDIFYPCEEDFVIAAEAQGFCYLYAPSYYLANNPGDYVGIMQKCRDTTQVESCLQGSGTQILEENLDEPAAAIEYCIALASDHLTSCTEGIYRLYASQFQSTERLIAICPELATEELQTNCKVWATLNKNFFANQVEEDASTIETQKH